MPIRLPPLAGVLLYVNFTYLHFLLVQAINFTLPYHTRNCNKSTELKSEGPKKWSEPTTVSSAKTKAPRCLCPMSYGVFFKVTQPRLLCPMPNSKHLAWDRATLVALSYLLLFGVGQLWEVIFIPP